MSNLGPRWTGSYHSKEGSKNVKGNERGAKRNEKRVKQKARGLRHNSLFILYSCT
jgi:hypothetical protein